MKQTENKLIRGAAASQDDYVFAELSANEFKELSDIERPLNQVKDWEIVILAYEKRKPEP